MAEEDGPAADGETVVDSWQDQWDVLLRQEARLHGREKDSCDRRIRECCRVGWEGNCCWESRHYRRRRNNCNDGSERAPAG